MNDLILGTNEELNANQKKIMSRDGSKVFPINPAMRKQLKTLKDSRVGDLKTQIDFIKSAKFDEYRKMREKDKNDLSKIVARASEKFRKKAIVIMHKKAGHDKKAKLAANKRDKQYKKEGVEFYKELIKLQKELPEGTIIEKPAYDFPLKAFRPKTPPKQDVWETTEEYEDRLQAWEDDQDDDEDNDDGNEDLVVSKYREYEQEQKNKNAFTLDFDKNAFDKRIQKEFNERYGEPFKAARERIEKLEAQFEEALLFGDVQVVKEIYYGLKQADDFLTQLKEMKLQ